MKDLSTLPLSVRQQLDRAQHLTHQNRPNDAKAAFQEAMTELARQDPMLCGLLFAQLLGRSGISATEVVTNEHTVRTAKKAFGITYGVDVTTTTDTHTRTRKISF